MKRVPKEIINHMFSILFVGDTKEITDTSSAEALEFAKSQEPKYRKILYAGLFLEIRAYQKRKKREKKQRQLLGED